jgi:hypothetical protein
MNTQDDDTRLSLPTQSATPRKWAQYLGSHGYRVLPIVITPESKKPRLIGRQESATNQADGIDALWDQSPNSDLGIATERTATV